MVKVTINQSHIDKLKNQRKVIGLLKFEDRDAKNFTKWYSLTENLVIRSFGQKSNQLSQLQVLRHRMRAANDADYEIRSKPVIPESKEKFKDLLSVFIDELNLEVENENPTGSKGINVKVNTNQQVSQTINLSVSINSIIDNIRNNEPDEARVDEAELKLRELEKEINENNPAWSKVKDILIWILNFSKDAFLQVLPIILDKYK